MAEQTIDTTLAEQLLAPFPRRQAQGRLGRYGYRESGEGKPLVLLHGIGAGSGSWACQLAGLAGRRVIAWDAPGYGLSTPLAASAPLAGDYAAALADFLEALGLDDIALLGHSLGALMAAAFARAHPARVRHFILASPAGGYGRADAAERAARTQPRLALMAELGPARHARERAPKLLRPGAPAAALALVAHSMALLHPDGYAQAVAMLAQGDILADVALWPRPLLVISGGADQVTPQAKCRAIAQAAAQGRYLGIAGAGHALYVEEPALFNEAVTDFLKATP